MLPKSIRLKKPACRLRERLRVHSYRGSAAEYVRRGFTIFAYVLYQARPSGLPGTVA
jgi:hypothetical protein